MKSVIAMKIVVALSCMYFFFQTELEALKTYTNFRSLANFTVLSNEKPTNLQIIIHNINKTASPPTTATTTTKNKIHSNSESSSNLALHQTTLKYQNQKLREELGQAQGIIQQLRKSNKINDTKGADHDNDNDDDIVIDNTREPTPIIDDVETPPGGGNCALLFFGVPRIFRQVALPSIRQHLVQPNKGCDVFVHSYNITFLKVNRNGENGPLNPNDLYDLTPNVVLETLDSFETKRSDVMPFFKEQHHTGWGTFDSTSNMMKAWHSIESVWNMMEEYQQQQQQQNNLTYNRVGIFRMDMYYPHPIYIGNFNEHAVIPDFGWDNLKIRDNRFGGFLNDRGIYGDYKYVKIWATQRFTFAQEFAAKQKQEGISGPILFRNGLRGVHSESILTEMVQHYQIPILQKDICFWRLRAGGLIRTGDCGGNTHNYFQEIEFNNQTLQGRRCQGPLFKSPPGPCVV